MQVHQRHRPLRRLCTCVFCLALASFALYDCVVSCGPILVTVLVFFNVFVCDTLRLAGGEPLAALHKPQFVPVASDASAIALSYGHFVNANEFHRSQVSVFAHAPVYVLIRDSDVAAHCTCLLCMRAVEADVFVLA